MSNETPQAGSVQRTGSALSCFDCAWHGDAGYLSHVTCRYPRERVPEVADLSGCHDGVCLTKDIAATVCPGFKSPNSEISRSPCGSTSGAAGETGQ